MPTRQFTDRAFDGVALMHLQLKGFGALFDPASLQAQVSQFLTENAGSELFGR
jgi:hypothetical protein